MKLSITAAWNETAAFVKQEAGALFLIVFGLGVLPGLIFQAIAQRFMVTPMVVRPGGPPPDMGPFLAMLPVFIVALIPLTVLSLWGNLTVNTLALRRETVIGSAFGHAARRILPLLGAWLVLFVAVVIVMAPLGLLMFSSARSGHWGVSFLAILLVWLALIFVGVRLMLIAPVAAAEPIGPINMIRRSWELTSSHFWKLIGFLILLFIVFLVLSVVVGAIGGIIIALVAGPPTPGSISSFIIQLITGILEAIFLTYFIVMIARIYVQLSGNVGSVAAVFE
jgi:hypothetical protein